MKTKLLYVTCLTLSMLTIACSDTNEPEVPQQPIKKTAYITRVLDFRPAPGQYINEMPIYEEGDTQETMNQKVLDAIGANRRGLVSLGGFGGYVVVGFDHTIENKKGKCDFRILGNAFVSSQGENRPVGGNSEPGIIRVAYDANGNGMPDEEEWFEIAGSAHRNPEGESWYALAQQAGNDVNRYTDYEITYYRPDQHAEQNGNEEYIRWEDNRGRTGYLSKNAFHKQSYYPQWIEQDQLIFRGTCLPQNSVDESGNGMYYVLYKFAYGYADNDTNTSDGSAIDIDWALDRDGNAVNLPGVDFIQIYTGVNQSSGQLGECSTEIMGVEDLHVLGLDISSAY